MARTRSGIWWPRRSLKPSRRAAAPTKDLEVRRSTRPAAQTFGVEHYASDRSWPIADTQPGRTSDLRGTNENRALTPISAFEEFLDLVEPALGARVVARAVLRADGLELAQQLTLALGEVDRRLEHHVAEEVAGHLAAHALDAFALEAEGLAGLRFGGHADLGRAVGGRDRDLAAERRGADGDRHLAMQVVVVALEHRVGLDVDLDVEVSGRAAVHPRLAFAGQSHAIAFV